MDKKKKRMKRPFTPEFKAEAVLCAAFVSGVSRRVADDRLSSAAFGISGTVGFPSQRESWWAG